MLQKKTVKVFNNSFQSHTARQNFLRIEEGPNTSRRRANIQQDKQFLTITSQKELKNHETDLAVSYNQIGNPNYFSLPKYQLRRLSNIERNLGQFNVQDEGNSASIGLMAAAHARSHVNSTQDQVLLSSESTLKIADSVNDIAPQQERMRYNENKRVKSRQNASKLKKIIKVEKKVQEECSNPFTCTLSALDFPRSRYISPNESNEAALKRLHFIGVVSARQKIQESTRRFFQDDSDTLRLSLFNQTQKSKFIAKNKSLQERIAKLNHQTNGYDAFQDNKQRLTALKRINESQFMKYEEIAAEGVQEQRILTEPAARTLNLYEAYKSQPTSLNEQIMSIQKHYFEDINNEFIIKSNLSQQKEQKESNSADAQKLLDNYENNLVVRKWLQDQGYESTMQKAKQLLKKKRLADQQQLQKSVPKIQKNDSYDAWYINKKFWGVPKNAGKQELVQIKELEERPEMIYYNLHSKKSTHPLQQINARELARENDYFLRINQTQRRLKQQLFAQKIKQFLIDNQQRIPISLKKIHISNNLRDSTIERQVGEDISQLLT